MFELNMLLKKQLSLYSELLDIESKKIEVLVKGQINKLDQIVKQEQSYIMSTINIEKQRSELLRSSGLEGISLVDIIKRTEEPKLADELLNIHNSLCEVLKELKRINFINQKLIKTRLNAIDQLIKHNGLNDGFIYKKDLAIGKQDINIKEFNRSI